MEKPWYYKAKLQISGISEALLRIGIETVAETRGSQPIGNRINKIREIRLHEGLPRARLAQMAKIADKTLKDIEKGDRLGSLVTRHKIVNALSSYEGRKRNYTFKDVFPCRTPE